MNKKLVFIILLGVVLAAPLCTSATVAKCGDPNDTAGNTQLMGIMGRITDAATVVGAAIAVIGFIVAGIMYLTSAGGEGMSTAKKALIAAVIGTALLALAQGGQIMTEVFCKIITG